MRRRALVLALAVAAVLAQAACGNRESIRGGGATVGKTLTIYSSLPSPARGSARDIVEGEKLALAEAHGKAGEYTINFSSLDEAGDGARAADAQRGRGGAHRDGRHADGGGDRHGRLRGRARLDPAAQRGGLPARLARRGLSGLHGPPRPGRAASAGSRPAGGRSRASSATTARRRRALVRAAGTRRVVVEAEGGEDAAALAAEVRRAAAAAGVKVVTRAGRDSAVIYAGEDPLAAAEVAASVARETPGARVVLPDAVVRNGVEAALKGPAARRAVLVSSAPEPGSTPALREFEAAFERAYGRRPGPTPRSATRRWRRCSPRSTARPPTTAPASGGGCCASTSPPAPRDTVAGPLRVLPSGARRAAAVHRVPFAEGRSRLGPGHERGCIHRAGRGPARRGAARPRHAAEPHHHAHDADRVRDRRRARRRHLRAGRRGRAARSAARSGPRSCSRACSRSSRRPPTPSSSRSTRRRRARRSTCTGRSSRTSSPSSSRSRSWPRASPPPRRSRPPSAATT